MTEEGIQTFAGCPYRKEYFRGDFGPAGVPLGRGDCLEDLCPDGGYYSARNMDYSFCKHPAGSKGTHTCRIGRGGTDVGTKWCEAALCAKTCPMGFVR